MCFLLWSDMNIAIVKICTQRHATVPRNEKNPEV